MIKITVYSNTPAGKGWQGLIALAGKVRQKYPQQVEVELIYPSQLPGVENLPTAPALAVGGKVFSKDVTMEDIEKYL